MIDQIRSVAQLCLTLCDPMNHSMPGLPVHHQLQEFTETHVHWVGDAIKPSHPLLSPSPLAPNLSQHQSLFQWVNSLSSNTMCWIWQGKKITIVQSTHRIQCFYTGSSWENTHKAIFWGTGVTQHRLNKRKSIKLVCVYIYIYMCVCVCLCVCVCMCVCVWVSVCVYVCAWVYGI